MTTSDIIRGRAIANDMAYIGRLIRDLEDLGDSPVTSTLAFCLIPYISLVVYESNRINASTTSLLPERIKAIVARSRNSLKLFDDNKRRISGQLEYFRKNILFVHRQYFLDRPPLRLGYLLGKDLGLFSYRSELVLTTHGANFNMGVEAAELFDMLTSGDDGLLKIYEGYGEYVEYLGARLDSDEGTFISNLNPGKFNQRGHDVRADKYYARIFGGPANYDLNVLLTVFRCTMNFVNVVAAANDSGHVEYTHFKIRFSALYGVISSLLLLRNDPKYTLDDRSVDFIDRICDAPEMQVIMDPAAKYFRNTLIHYGLDSHVDFTKIDPDEPLFGLGEIYYSFQNSASLSKLVDSCISHAALALNEWAAD